MPKIRSITYFDNTPTGKNVQFAKDAFHAAGIDVQSARLATEPFPTLVEAGEAPTFAKSLMNESAEAGFDYVSLGPVRFVDSSDYIQVIPQIFSTIQNVFATVEIANADDGIDLSRLMETAKLIKQVSTITDDGFSNLYLAAIANCEPGSPFFPVAYHDGGEPAFALAMQSADLAVQAFTGAPDPVAAGKRLTANIEDTARQLIPAAGKVAEELGLRFLGFDFSLAPFPTPQDSLAGAMEALSTRFNGSGLVASASVVMNAIEEADFPRAGFCGLMLPVLEDTVLAENNAQGHLSINKLLLLSAICGTGLDCIPLPGNINPHVLRDILLDVAALALRLDKPLTARLMPFPGKKSGDKLAFDFPYFADSTVMVSPKAYTGAYDSSVRFEISPRKDRT